MRISYLCHYYRTHKSKLIKNLFENMFSMYVHKFQKKSYCEKKTRVDNNNLMNIIILCIEICSSKRLNTIKLYKYIFVRGAFKYYDLN